MHLNYIETILFKSHTVFLVCVCVCALPPLQYLDWYLTILWSFFFSLTIDPKNKRNNFQFDYTHSQLVRLLALSCVYYC